MPAPSNGLARRARTHQLCACAAYKIKVACRIRFLRMNKNTSASAPSPVIACSALKTNSLRGPQGLKRRRKCLQQRHRSARRFVAQNFNTPENASFHRRISIRYRYAENELSSSKTRKFQEDVHVDRESCRNSWSLRPAQQGHHQRRSACSPSILLRFGRVGALLEIWTNHLLSGIYRPGRPMRGEGIKSVHTS